jgi:hypothetical protein
MLSTVPAARTDLEGTQDIIQLSVAPIGLDGPPRSGSIEDAALATLSGLTPGLLHGVKVMNSGLFNSLQPASQEPSDLVMATWQHQLLVGAVAERLATTDDLHDALPTAGYVMISSSGDVLTADGAGATMPNTGHIAARQLFAADGLSDAAVTADITGALAEHGLRTERVAVLHALGPALIVTAIDDHAVTLSEARGVAVAIWAGAAPKYPGGYLEIRSPRGAQYAVVTTSLRTGAGTSYTPDSALDDTRRDHPRRVGHEHPPCG